MKTLRTYADSALAAFRTRLVDSPWLIAAGLGLFGLQAWGAQFTNVTTAAGLLLSEGAGCYGAAWGDYDNDGYIDLYIPVGLGTPHANALYHNNGNGTFTRKTGAQVGPIASDTHNSTACYWLDFNNNGYLDMLVLNGTDSPDKQDLYMNNGDGTFRRASAGNLTGQAMLTSFAAPADYDGDGLVDVYLATAYSANGPFYPRLYHATPSGIFASIDIGPPTQSAYDGVWGDYNNDGKPDLFVSNLDSPSCVWRNDGGGHFTQITNGLASGRTMYHAAWGDYDNDGNLDIAISIDGGTCLYRNDGQGGFVLVTNFAAFGAAWADYDNDGHLDLLCWDASGFNGPRSPLLLHNNGDGTFTSLPGTFPPAADDWLMSATGDYDNDGFMDVLLTHGSGQNKLFHNLGNTNHWIKFKLIGTASNRDAIGAKVRVKATIAGQTVWQLREVNGGYAVQNDMRPNFGLGDATNVDQVRIEWPSGIVQTLTNVAHGQTLTVVEHQAYSGIAPAFAGATTVTNGLQLSIAEPTAGAVYTVEASINLVNWTKLVARTSAAGTFAYTDTATASHPQRFYRLVVP